MFIFTLKDLTGPKTITDGIKHIINTQGLIGFYRGFIPIWSRATPVATLQLIVYDNLLLYMGKSSI